MARQRIVIGLCVVMVALLAALFVILSLGPPYSHDSSTKADDDRPREQGNDPADSARSDEDAATAPQQEEEPPHSTHDEAKPPTDSEPPHVPEEEQVITGSIRGTVRDLEGHPVAGVRMLLGMKGSGRIPAQTVSDAQGRYEFAELDLQVYALDVARRGFELLENEAIELTRTSAHAISDVTLARLSLEIVPLESMMDETPLLDDFYIATDEHGTPCEHLSADRGDDGVLRLGRIDPQELAGRWLYAEGRGATPIPYQSPRMHGEGLRIICRIRDGAVLRVRVERTDGGPTDDISIRVRLSGRTRSTGVGSDGVVDFAGLSEGRYRIGASVMRQRQLPRQQLSEDEARRVMFRAEDRHSIHLDRDEVVVEKNRSKVITVRIHIVDLHGTLLDEHGVPIGGATVYPNVETEDHGVTTSALGAFRIVRPIGEDFFTVQVEWQGERRSFQVTSPPIDDATNPYPVTLRWASPEVDTLHIELIDAHTSSPICGARINLVYIDEGGPFRGEGETDNNGRTRIEQAPLGLYHLSATHPGYRALEAKPLHVEDYSLQVKLEPEGVIRWQLNELDADPRLVGRGLLRVQITQTDLDSPNLEPVTRTFNVYRDDFERGYPQSLRIGHRYRLEVTVPGFETFTLEAVAEHADVATIHQVSLNLEE